MRTSSKYLVLGVTGVVTIVAMAFVRPHWNTLNDRQQMLAFAAGLAVIGFLLWVWSTVPYQTPGNPRAVTSFKFVGIASGVLFAATVYALWLLHQPNASDANVVGAVAGVSGLWGCVIAMIREILRSSQA